MSQKQLNLVTTYYSDNLGDAVIGDTLAWQLKQIQPELSVRQIDLSGRTAFANHYLKNKGKLQQIIAATPRRLRPLLVWLGWHLKVKKHVLKTWEETIIPKAPIVLGGGQLLMDNSLNFPLKVAALATFSRRSHQPLAIGPVGVGGRWSKAAQNCFKKFINHAEQHYLAVRETGSQWRCYKQTGHEPRLSVDPAIVAKQTYATIKRPKNADFIGLGLAQPNELRLAASNPRDFNSASIAHFWRELIELYQKRGEPVLIFTNGAAEDEAFVDRVMSKLKNDEGIVRAPRPEKPDELIKTLRRCRALIAHRMHAGIIAYSYDIPTVALGWDNKVSAWMERIQRAKFCIPSSELNAATVAKRLEKSQQTPYDKKIRQELEKLLKSESKFMLQRLDLC